MSWTQFFFPCFSSFSLLFSLYYPRMHFFSFSDSIPPPSRKDDNNWLYWRMKETGIYCALRARSSSRSDDEGPGVPNKRRTIRSGHPYRMGNAVRNRLILVLRHLKIKDPRRLRSGLLFILLQYRIHLILPAASFLLD